MRTSPTQDGPETATAVGLRYVRPYADAGFGRRRAGRGFRYVDERGRTVDARNAARARSLAIPPAWVEVWIARDPRAHIQAAGRDARRRLQYIYHRQWSEARTAAKYGRLAAFCRKLPALRRRIAHDLRCRCLCHDAATASVIALIESGHLRVGNDVYTRENGTYGATTLECRHLRLHGDRIELVYRGKSSIVRRVQVEDHQLAAVLRKARALPGRRLFQYKNGDDSVHAVSSNDVNRYLHDALGGDFSAKDFRTWAATLWCALLLGGEPAPASATAAKRTVKQAIAEVADHLGHTPAVCRASYIHPRVVEAYTGGRLQQLMPRALCRRADHDVADLRSAERRILSLLTPRAASTASAR